MSQVLVTDPKELEKIREREGDITKERIDKFVSLMSVEYYSLQNLKSMFSIPDQVMHGTQENIRSTICTTLHKHTTKITSSSHKNIAEYEISCCIGGLLLSISSFSLYVFVTGQPDSHSKTLDPSSGTDARWLD